MIEELELVYLSKLNKLLIEIINGDKQINVEELKHLQPHLAALCSSIKKQHITALIQARQK